MVTNESSDVDAITKGLADCSEGLPYPPDAPAEKAAYAAYVVLRCCGLITAGDWRVCERIGRTAQAMIEKVTP